MRTYGYARCSTNEDKQDINAISVSIVGKPLYTIGVKMVLAALIVLASIQQINAQFLVDQAVNTCQRFSKQCVTTSNHNKRDESKDSLSSLYCYDHLSARLSWELQLVVAIMHHHVVKLYPIVEYSTKL